MHYLGDMKESNPARGHEGPPARHDDAASEHSLLPEAPFLSLSSSKAEDEKFLADLTKQCADKTAEYEDLKMVRANEEAAVAQAIFILNSDAAFESFGATAAGTSGNTGFILLRYSTTVRRQVRHLLEIPKEKDESKADHEGH